MKRPKSEKKMAGKMKVGRGREEERETEKEREKCFHINGFLVELSGFSIDFLSV
jgi:hypothetical protein